MTPASRRTRCLYCGDLCGGTCPATTPRRQLRPAALDTAIACAADHARALVSGLGMPALASARRVCRSRTTLRVPCCIDRLRARLGRADPTPSD